MAPEQLKALTTNGANKDYIVGPFDDLKADIWSIGCFIWYVLTFGVPFEGATLEDMVRLLTDPNL